MAESSVPSPPRGGEGIGEAQFKFSKIIAIILLRLYQLLLSPFLAMNGGRCRFHPNCSAYAIEAIQSHGTKKGVGLAARRLARCHPWGGHGYDPVPPASEAG